MPNGNPFDQFDSVATAEANPFDQFDGSSSAIPALVSPYKEKQKYGVANPVGDNKIYFGGQTTPVTTTANKEPVGNHFTDDEIKQLVGNLPLPSQHGQEEQQAQQLGGISNALEQGLLRGKGTSLVNPLGAFIGSIDNAVKTGQQGADALSKTTPAEYAQLLAQLPVTGVQNIPDNVKQGIAQTVLANTAIPFHLGMAMTPGGAAFLEGQGLADATLPENISKWQAPITAATNPQTETGKSTAGLADMGLQLLLAHYLGKGITALKGNNEISPIEDLNKENQNAISQQSTETGNGDSGTQSGGVIPAGQGTTENVSPTTTRLRNNEGEKPSGTRGNNTGTETPEEGSIAPETIPQEVQNSQEVANQLPPEIAPTTPETGQGLNVNQSAGKVLTPEEYQALRDELKNKLNENQPVEPLPETPENPFNKFDESTAQPVNDIVPNPVENIPENNPENIPTENMGKIPQLPDNNAEAIKNLTDRGKTPEEISTVLQIPVKDVNKAITSPEPTEIPNSPEVNAENAQSENGQNLSNEGENKAVIPASSPIIPPFSPEIPADKIESLKSDLIDLRDNYNDLTGSARMKARKPIQDNIKQLRALGVDADFKVGKITIDGKPIRKPTVQPERVDLSTVEVRPEAEKPFEELHPDIKDRQEIIAENFVDPKDLPTGAGKKTLEKGIQQIKDDNGDELKPEAKVVRDAAENILENGKEIQPIKGARNSKQQISPDEVKSFVDQKLEDKGDTSFNFGENAKPDFELTPPETKNSKAKPEQLEMQGLGTPSFKKGEEYLKPTGKPEESTPLFNQGTETKGQENLFENKPEISKGKEPFNIAEEAKKYKTADEFVNAIKANPERIPTTPEYQKFLKEKDAFVKRENEIYSEMEAMRDKYSGKTVNEVPPDEITKYENLDKELKQTLSKKTMAEVPEGVIKTHIGEKGLESQLTDIWNKTNPDLVDKYSTPEAPVKEDLKQGEKPKEMNFTEFAVSKGYPSDYDVLDHGTLSPNGHISKRAKDAELKSQLERSGQNTKAHEEYRQAILNGEIIDPEGKITKERLISETDKSRLDKAQSDIKIIDNHIKDLENLGKMSHKENGELKIGYQRSVDDYLKQKEQILKDNPELQTEKPNRFISDETHKSDTEYLKNRIDEMKNQRGSGPNLTPEDIGRLARIGAYHVENGARNFIDWSKKMMDDFGDKIKPYLLDIWRQTKNDYSHLFKDEKTGPTSKEEDANLSENQTVPSEKIGNQTKTVGPEDAYKEAKKNNDYQTVGKYHLDNLKKELGDNADIYPDWRKKMVKDFGLDTGQNFRKIWNDIKNKPELSDNESVTPEGKIVEQPELKRTPGTAKASYDINSRMVKEGMEELPDTELAKYNPITKADQIERVTKQLDSDYEKSKSMAAGKETIPPDIHPQVLFNAVKNRAIEEGDVETLKDLALSPLAKERSVAAQTLGASGFDNGEKVGDPVQAMADVIDSREKSFGHQEQQKRAAEYEKKIQDLESKLQEKDDLLKKAEAESAFKKIQRDSDYQARRERRTMTKDQLKEERTHLYADLYKELGTLNAGIPISGKALKVLGELTKNYAQEGLISAESVIDAIHNELKDKIEGITPRDIRDAISRYGQETKTKTRTQLQKDVYDLKQQAKVISQIEDLESGKVPESPARTKSKPSEELQTLRNELKTKLDEHGITEQKSLTRSKELIKQKILDYTDKLNKGDYSKEEKTTPIDDEKAKLQSQLDDVRKRWNYIRDSLGEVLSSEEAKNITDLSQKISETKAKMDGAPRREVGKPATEEELEYGRARVAFAEYIDQLKASANKLTWQEFKSNPHGVMFNALKHIPGITKSAKATLDNSGLFNQNITVLMTHPQIWARNAIKSFEDIARTLGNKNVYDELSADIVSRPNYDNYLKDGLAVGVIEEAFPDSKILEKIPILGRVHKAAEVAFTGLAYRNRADVYDLLTEAAKNGGHEETTGLGIGKIVNSLTGRGSLGGLERAGSTINTLLFAPRFVKSHFDVLTANSFSRDMTPFARKQAALNLLKIVGSISAVTVAANALRPGSVETDPRSTDFAKIKIGDTRFNFTGGLGSLVTLATRLITRSTKNNKGEIVPLNSGKFGSQTGWDVLLNFMNGKLSPVAGIARDFLQGQDFSGNRLTLGGELQNLTVPLPITNVQEFLNDPKSANIIAGEIADALGIFTNTYSNDPDLQKVKNALLKADEEKMTPDARSNFFHSVYKAERNQAITHDQAAQYRKQFRDLQRTAPRAVKVKSQSNHATER